VNTSYAYENEREVAALIEVGVLSSSSGRATLECLLQRSADFVHMGVSERVDLARDIVEASSRFAVS
jgi:hypothetical protein